MKKPRPPLELIEREKFIGNLKYWRKISKLWGFQSHNGVLVYWKQQTYYKGSVSPGFYEFVRLVGMENSIRHRTKGLKRAWLYLNRSKAERKVGRPNIQHPATIATNVNSRIRNQIQENILVTNPRVEHDLFNSKLPAPALPSWYDSENPAHHRQLFAQWILDGKGIAPTDPDEDPYLETIAVFAALENVLNVQVEKPFLTSFQTEEPYLRTVCDARSCWTELETRTVAIPSWSFRITVPASTTTFDNNHAFIQRIYSNVGALMPETSSHEDFQGPTTPGNPVNEIWYGGYLRESFLRYTGMKVVDKIEYFFAAIDNGYKKKKKKGFKKFVGIIIAIVIVIAAFWTGQWYAANAGFTIGAGATVGALIVGVGIAVVVAATAITIALMVGNMLGLSEYMGPLASFMHMMAPLVRIAQIITIVYAIVTVVQQIGQQAAQQAAQQGAQQAAQQGAQQGVQQAGSTLGQQAVQSVAKPTIQNYVSAAFNTAKDSIIGSGPVGSFGPETVQRVVKVADYVANKYYDSKNEKMMRELNKEAVLLAQEKELTEQFQTNHILMDMIRTEPLLSVAAESQYVEIYDRPYEWWATPYHLGCMQANTVHAMMYLDA